MLPFHPVIIIVIKVFIKCKILSVEKILSTYMHTHTHTQVTPHPHPPSTLTIQTLIYTQLKTSSKERLEMDEDSSG